jgi:hypothetical protein
MTGKEPKPFSELYPDKIVSVLKNRIKSPPTIIIATERNIFEIIDGEIVLLKFTEAPE